MASNERKDRGQLSSAKKDVQKVRHTELEDTQVRLDPRKRKGYAPDLSRPIHQIMPIVFGAMALFFAICFIFDGSGAIVGDVIRVGFYGLLGRIAASLIPLALLLYAFFWRQSVRQGCIVSRTVSVILMYVALATLVYTFANTSDEIKDFDLISYFTDGHEASSGGLFGNLISFLLVTLFDKVGTYIIAIVFFIAFAVVCFGFTPSVIAARIRDRAAARANERAEERRELREEKEGYRQELRRVKQQQRKTEQREKLAKQAEEQRARYEEKLEQKKQKDSLEAERKIARKARYRDEIDIAIDDEDELPVPDPAKEEEDELGGGITTVRADAIMNRPPRTRVAEAQEKTEFRPNYTVKISGVKQDAKKEEDAPFDFASVTEHVELEGKPAKAAQDTRTPTAAPTVPTTAKAAPAKKAAPLVTPDMISTKTHIDSTDKPVGEILEVENEEERKERERKEAIEKMYANYAFPPFTLLNPGKEADAGNITEEINANAEKLVETLTSFNVRTHISSVSRGPRITRYELVPEAGVRIRSIANLIDDISMNLATAGIRIEAPIPGKSAVGIEVPNKVSSTVSLRELLENDSFKNAAAPTTVCVGADVTGEPVYGDLAKMPHTLIAGATGMGKSVCINTIITSILYKARPDEVKLILVDPKKVELGVYNGIPHLLVPVVIDPKKATGALSWAVCEMERRFDLIEEAGVRDLKGYNKTLEEHPEREKLPSIIIVIDELNDLMMVASDSVEASICRIAQKARAAGIHLIIGTQRPSVDVITGTIKANIPSRIAFHVASQIDSRTILDTAGAEKLLNNGDMLYYPVGVPKPLRVQGAFISDGEVEKVTSFLKENSLPDTYNREIMENIEREAEKCSMGKKGASAEEPAPSGDGEEDFSNPKFREAVELAIDEGKISTSLIQRRLKLGFGKAARFIDIMQRMGIVSEPDGQKPRTTLITRDQFYDMLNRLTDKTE